MASAFSCTFEGVSSPSVAIGVSARRLSKFPLRPRARAMLCAALDLGMSNRPFHHAFAVKDLASTRAFYGTLLGCREGRSTETWVDFDFYGNQISAHLGSPTPAASIGHVEGIAVPIPHFGALLGWEEFQTLANRLKAAGTQFIIPPSVRYVGQPAEQATMFFLDPSGNPLELKAFRDQSAAFAR